GWGGGLRHLHVDRASNRRSPIQGGCLRTIRADPSLFDAPYGLELGSQQVIVRPLCGRATRGHARFFYRPGVPEGINGLVEAGGLEETWIDVTTLDDEVATLALIPAIIKTDVVWREPNWTSGRGRRVSCG